ncbi:MAG TPA: GNAT family N-acetyltransferase [Burkholderiaceae bacterium]
MTQAPEAWAGEAFKATLETVLHSRRLLLEPLNPAHADELLAPLADPRLYTHVPQDPPVSLEALRARFVLLAARRSPAGDQLWLNWVLRDQHDGQARGRVQATVSPEARAWIAYEVFPEHWGRGFASEGCRRMMEWLIDTLGVRQFAAEVDTLNDASLRLLERLGFQRVSLHEAADEFKGRVSDEWTLRLDAAAFVRAGDVQRAPGGAAAGPS